MGCTLTFVMCVYMCMWCIYVCALHISLCGECMLCAECKLFCLARVWLCVNAMQMLMGCIFASFVMCVYVCDVYLYEPLIYISLCGEWISVFVMYIILCGEYMLGCRVFESVNNCLCDVHWHAWCVYMCVMYICVRNTYITVWRVNISVRDVYYSVWRVYACVPLLSVAWNSSIDWRMACLILR
jgi:hypothetical protein